MVFDYGDSIPQHSIAHGLSHVIPHLTPGASIAAFSTICATGKSMTRGDLISETLSPRISRRVVFRVVLVLNCSERGHSRTSPSTGGSIKDVSVESGFCCTACYLEQLRQRPPGLIDRHEENFLVSPNLHFITPHTRTDTLAHRHLPWKCKKGEEKASSMRFEQQKNDGRLLIPANWSIFAISARLYPGASPRVTSD